MDYRDHEIGHRDDGFWFRAKNDLISILMKKCSLKRRLKILNLGAGTGDDLDVLNQFGDNYVVDIDKKALSLIDGKKCIEKRQADACRLPYKPGFFDAVVSFDVFEHVKDDKKAISEVYRVLKKGGVLVFTVPAFQSLFSSHDRALKHMRRYGRKEMIGLLSGFRETETFYWNSLLFIPIAMMRIAKRRSKARVDHAKLSRPADWLLHRMISIDNSMIKNDLSMPIGLTIAGICRK